MRFQAVTARITTSRIRPHITRPRASRRGASQTPTRTKHSPLLSRTSRKAQSNTSAGRLCAISSQHQGRRRMSASTRWQHAGDIATPAESPFGRPQSRSHRRRRRIRELPMEGLVHLTELPLDTFQTRSWRANAEESPDRSKVSRKQVTWEAFSARQSSRRSVEQLRTPRSMPPI